jgi:hypothetical protein
MQVGCDQYGHRLLMVGVALSGPVDSTLPGRLAEPSCKPRREARRVSVPGPRFGSIQRAMRRLLATLTSSLLLLLVLAPAALAENDGRGFYGATDDKVVTDAGFILIIFFPTFVFVMSMLQRRLEKRKEASKAAKKQLGGIEWHGGW